MAAWIAWAQANQTVLLLVAAAAVVIVPRLWTWLASSGGSGLEWLKGLVPKAAEPTPAVIRTKLIAAYDTLHDGLPECQGVLQSVVWPAVGRIGRQTVAWPEPPVQTEPNP